MAIASLKEFEKKTKDYLNELKEEVKRFERVVNNTNDKLRWEGASYVLDSISKSAEYVAKAMRDFQNNLKMGKVEESVKPARRSFRQYLTEATKVPYLLKNAKVGDTFHDGSDLGREYKITRVTPSKVYATCVKDPNVTGEYNRSHSDYNETDPQWAKLYTIK